MRRVDVPGVDARRQIVVYLHVVGRGLRLVGTDVVDDLRAAVERRVVGVHATGVVVDLVALTRQVMNQFQAITNQHQLVFQAEIAHLWASVDACRIEQVLSNLLMNAIKYSPEGGPIEVMIWNDGQAHEACFSVRDQGIGIPQEQQAHIFERFVRAKNAQAARISGTGLGLFLCRELIERHGGRISFQSEEGVGTTFFFTLPCNTVADARH